MGSGITIKTLANQGNSTWFVSDQVRQCRKPGCLKTLINQRLIRVKWYRVINRVIRHFVALFNKLTFCPVFTRDETKNQVGGNDFTSGGIAGVAGVSLMATRSFARVGAAVASRGGMVAVTRAAVGCRRVAPTLAEATDLK